MTLVKVGLEYDRPVPEAWERAVWAVAPPSNFLSWLRLVWEPGDVWEPVERWMIYQMRAPRFVRPEMLKELRGPSPRSTGHYCTRWWCIQGDQGGHRHRLDRIEAKVSRLHNGPNDTPAPGDLPYADFDSRVFHKIVQLDRVRMWKGVTDFVSRNHAQMDAEERDEGERAQWAMWGWLGSQVKRTVDKIGKSGAQLLKEAAPRVLGKSTTPLDEDTIQRDFIMDHDS